jgi:site-specific DNA-methyltransferase (adenine-specific)
MDYKVLQGNCLDRLKDIETNSIHYENCEHEGNNLLGNNRNGLSSGDCSRQANNPALSSGQCIKCGAIKEDEQIGLESSLQGYIDNMVKVFREVRRVLRDDGTVWLNIGDSYNGSGGAGGDYNKGGLREGQNKYGKKDDPRFKPKDLMLVPHRLAIALQEDGWWVRQDIVWAKNNPMPEPAKDRCVKAHEYIFLLTKSKDYYFDYQAIQEETSNTNKKNKTNQKQTKYKSIEEEATYRQGMHKDRGKNIVYFRPKLPNQNDFVDFIRLNPKENLSGLGIKQSTIDHWYRYDQSGFSYPSVEDWEVIYPYLVNEDKEQMNSLMTTLDWKYDDVKFNGKRNKRSVWTVNTKAYKGAHFAVFPPDLVEPCILTTPTLTCGGCGKGYIRNTITETILTKEEAEAMMSLNSNKEDKPYSVKELRSAVVEFRNLPNHEEFRKYLKEAKNKTDLTIAKIEELFDSQAPHHWFEKGGSYPSVEDWSMLKEMLNLDDTYDTQMTEVFYKSGLKGDNSYSSNGFVKDCSCDTEETKPAVVLDIFGGSGTTAGVALKNGRDALLIELNPEYVELIDKRIESILNFKIKDETRNELF